eukprot:8586090-Alexandrium_andersonii.AAC.1
MAQGGNWAGARRCARGDTESPEWGCHGRRPSAWHRAEIGLARAGVLGAKQRPLMGLPWEADLGMAQGGNWA